MKLPKCYAIFCSQTSWKKEAVSRRFVEAGIEVEWVQGIHGATAGISTQLPYWDNPKYYIPVGKLGTTISKLLTWTICVERGEEELIIFEDDVVLCPSFKKEFETSYKALPPDWQVVHLGHCCTEGLPSTQINDRVWEIQQPLCCHAVLWKRAALIYTLDYFRRVSFGSPSDITLARLIYPKLRSYSLVPPLAFQEDKVGEAQLAARWDTIQGWFTYATLYDEALNRVKKPSTFVEIGCWKGRSSAYMGEQIKRRMLPVEFYAIDTWKGSPGKEEHQAEVARLGGDMYPVFVKNMSRAGVIDYVKPIQSESVEAAKRFADGSLDFIFVDGDHRFPGVVADIRAWRPKLSPTGVMAGDDWNLDGVAPAVKQEFGEGNYRLWQNHWIVDPKKR